VSPNFFIDAGCTYIICPASQYSGVIVFNGRFFSWPRLEQGVATLLLFGLGWLLVRTAE
jgi:hypothetical protein